MGYVLLTRLLSPQGTPLCPLESPLTLLTCHCHNAGYYENHPRQAAWLLWLSQCSGLSRSHAAAPQVSRIPRFTRTRIRKRITLLAGCGVSLSSPARVGPVGDTPLTSHLAAPNTLPTLPRCALHVWPDRSASTVGLPHPRLTAKSLHLHLLAARQAFRQGHVGADQLDFRPPGVVERERRLLGRCLPRV
jgi:hypothetical protein